MGFLLSNPTKLNKRGVVVTVTLPKDVKLKERVLCTAAATQLLPVKNLDNNNHYGDHNHIGDGNTSKSAIKETDDTTASTDPTASCGTMTSKDMDSSFDSLNEIEYGEIPQSGSADSYVSSSLSSLSCDDGGDDTHVLEIKTINVYRNISSGSSSSNNSGSSSDSNVDASRDAEKENGKEAKQPNNQNLMKPPIQPTSASTSTTKTATDNTLSPTKAQTIREMRRTASNGSKNYVHVFHNQLTTLKEQPSKEDYNDDDGCNSDNDSIYGIGHGQHHAVTTAFDEHDLRQRWDYSLKIMTKLKKTREQ